MPGGRTHDAITVATAAVGAPVAIWAGAPVIEVGALAAAYIFSGFFFSPDLDLHSRPYMRWHLFRFLWWPYQVLVPHRSWASHSLLVGPLLRVAYFIAMLYGVGLLVLLALQLAVPIDTTGTLWLITHRLLDYIQLHPQFVLLGLLSFVASSMTHVIADVIYSGIKRQMHRHRGHLF